MMSIGLMFLLFIFSVFLCAVAGSIVKQRKIQVPKTILVVFHLVYITGLVAAYILL